MIKKIQTIRRIEYDKVTDWWVVFEACYMYGHRAYLNCVWQILTQWEDERHVVG